VPLAYLPAGTSPGALVSPFFWCAPGGWEEKSSSRPREISDLTPSPVITLWEGDCGRGFSPDVFRALAMQRQPDPPSRLKPLLQCNCPHHAIWRKAPFVKGAGRQAGG